MVILKIYLLDLCCAWQEKAFLEWHDMHSYLSSHIQAWSDFFWSGLVLLAFNNDKAELRHISAWCVNPWSPGSAGLPSPLPQTSAVPFPQLFCSCPASKHSCTTYSQGLVNLPVPDGVLELSFSFHPLSFPDFFSCEVNRCSFNLERTLTALFYIQLLKAYGQD